MLNFSKATDVGRLMNAFASLLSLRNLGRLIPLLCFYLVSTNSAIAQLLELDDLPPALNAQAHSNVIVTVDDSGSMAWGFMPDTVGANWREVYYRGSKHNKNYYDPALQYFPPLNAEGLPLADANYFNATHGHYYLPAFRVQFNLSSAFEAVHSHRHNVSTPDFLGAEENVDGCDTSPGGPCDPQPAYYYQFDQSFAACTAIVADQPTDSACYQKIVIDTDSYIGPGSINAYGRSLVQEQTNFANWFQYYSVRGDAVKTALTHAFAPGVFDSSFRVGRQSLNSGNLIGSGSSATQVSSFDMAERQSFYQWIYSIPTEGGTPLRSAVVRVGDYFSTLDAYRHTPGDADSGLASCRSNINMMVTDGAYNGSVAAPNAFFMDDDFGFLPDGTPYTPGETYQRVYPNSLSDNSMADLTWHYWASDLVPSLQNNVIPYYTEVVGVADEDYWNPRNNPATWQSMTSHIVGFSIVGNVPASASVYQSLLDGSNYVANDGTMQNGWPATDVELGISDDIYHATINGRGKFFNSADAGGLMNGLTSLTQNISDAASVIRSRMIGAAGFHDGTLYINEFDIDKWTSNLIAQRISDGSLFIEGVVANSCNALFAGSLCETRWESAHQNNENSLHLAPAFRAVFTYNNTSVFNGDPAGVGSDFRWPSLNTSQQLRLNASDGLGAERVNYLRGDDSQELDNGGSFRVRASDVSGSAASRLGAAFYSQPVVVGTGRSQSGALVFDLPNDLEPQSYTVFVDSLLSRRPMVYLGANDGMLHAFSAEPESASANPSSDGGSEIFSYIPDAIIEKLPELTSRAFDSAAFVDGEITVQDVFYDNSWHTILVGALRTGAQGIYALDITDPDADAASIVRWEYTDLNNDDVGYTFGKPIIAKANNGRWVVIVANGYNATEVDNAMGAGAASLLVLDIEDGSTLAVIPVGDGTLAQAVGLSSPVAALDTSIDHFAGGPISDADDYTVDYVYAGDTSGKLWKFDLSSTAPQDWNTAHLLFDAGAGQPISLQPTIASLDEASSSAGGSNGRFIYFGTGQYFAYSDHNATELHAIYGLIDTDDCVGGSSACIAEADLLGQSIASGQVSNNLREAHHQGWRLSLSDSLDGIRLASPAVAQEGLLLFASLQPDTDACSPDPASYLNAVNRLTGGATNKQVLDSNNDGVVDDNDRDNFGLGAVLARKMFSGVATQMTVATTNQTNNINTIYLAGGLFGAEPFTAVSEDESLAAVIISENVPFIPYWAYGVLVVALTMFGAKGFLRN